VTNNESLSPSEVINQYTMLPQVERSFRMSKSDLKIRPIYHQLSTRIEAHVIICMISLVIMRVIEAELKPSGYTLNEVLHLLNNTKSSVVASRSTQFTYPPRLSVEFCEITEALRMDIKTPKISIFKMVT
jgi:transposase